MLPPVLALGWWRSAGRAGLSRAIHPRARTAMSGEGRGGHRPTSGRMEFRVGTWVALSPLSLRAPGVSADSGVRRWLPHRSGIGTERIGCRGFTGACPSTTLDKRVVAGDACTGSRPCQGKAISAHPRSHPDRRSQYPRRSSVAPRFCGRDTAYFCVVNVAGTNKGSFTTLTRVWP